MEEAHHLTDRAQAEQKSPEERNQEGNDDHQEAPRQYQELHEEEHLPLNQGQLGLAVVREATIHQKRLLEGVEREEGHLRIQK